jgi:rare lipoprotein A
MKRSLAALLRISLPALIGIMQVAAWVSITIGYRLYRGSVFLLRRYGPPTARVGLAALNLSQQRVRAVTRRQWLVTAITVVTILPACVPVRWEQRAPESQRVEAEPTRSKRGNPPFYEVYGVRYHVQESSYGHRERGVASWYGKKFHGRQTSSGEIYDMYAMTAAHKTLPLPTHVRVTHLGNGKSIVLKVNDRGPFVDDRIIDLSYAAALQLDMIGTGTAMVDVEALTQGRAAPTQTTVSIGPTAPIPLAPPISAPSDNKGLPSPPTAEAELLFLQVGAFGDVINAEYLQSQLRAKGLSNVVIRYDLDSEVAPYRVRLGPIIDATEYDSLVELMAKMEIQETHLVTESANAAPNDESTAPGGS